jgi:hypothetical protein
MKFDFSPKLSLVARRQGIDEPETHVVTSGLVLGTRIAQADDEPYARVRHPGSSQGQG